MSQSTALGIDFGGSAIKAAIVDINKGVLLTERHRIETPSPSNPKNINEVFEQIIKHFNWTGDIGLGFPAVVSQGIIKTASNIDKSWIDVDAAALISNLTKGKAVVLNDADAAGMAELNFGAGKHVAGTVVLLTIGTGIGSVLFSEGKLVQNTELGQLIMPNGKIAEKYTAASIKENKKLSWANWGKRFNKYLFQVENIIRPDLIIIGGGISAKPEKFMPYISIKTKVLMAKNQNEAGIIGAALATTI